jgi:hypothetical protein
MPGVSVVRTLRVPTHVKRGEKSKTGLQPQAGRSTLKRTWCQGLDDGGASDCAEDLNDRQNRGSHGTQRADE